MACCVCVSKIFTMNSLDKENIKENIKDGIKDKIKDDIKDNIKPHQSVSLECRL